MDMHFIAPFNLELKIFKMVYSNIGDLDEKNCSAVSINMNLNNILFKDLRISKNTHVHYEYKVYDKDDHMLVEEYMFLSVEGKRRRAETCVSFQSKMTKKQAGELFQRMVKAYIILKHGKIDTEAHKVKKNFIKILFESEELYYGNGIGRDQISTGETAEIVYITFSDSGHYFISPVPDQQKYLNSLIYTGLIDRGSEDEGWKRQMKVIKKVENLIEKSKIKFLF